MTAPLRAVIAFSANGTMVLDCGHKTVSRRGHRGGGWTPVFVDPMPCTMCEADADGTLRHAGLRRGQGLPCASCGLRRWSYQRQYHTKDCLLRAVEEMGR